MTSRDDYPALARIEQREQHLSRTFGTNPSGAIGEITAALDELDLLRREIGGAA